MGEQIAFAELLRRHEELTQRFAQLLHDDAGQILTSIALQLSVLEGVDPAEREPITSTLDELLDRFREAQASLGGAVIKKRGLAAGLSQLAKMRKEFRIVGDLMPKWPLAAQQAAFRIVEALESSRAELNADGIWLHGVGKIGEYVAALAETGGLSIQKGPQARTIRIYHVNSGSNSG